MNIYGQEYARLVQIQQKKISDHNMSQQIFISGPDQPDDQPEHRLELTKYFIAFPLNTPGLEFWVGHGLCLTILSYCS